MIKSPNKKYLLSSDDMTDAEFIEALSEAVERLDLESEVRISEKGMSIPRSWGPEKTEKIFTEIYKYIQHKNRKTLH